MLRYARTAVPWTRVVVVAVLVLVLLDVVRRWPFTMWPLEGCAVGLLAAGAAWCYDEPAAAVADSTPRGLAWRTCARGLGVLALVAVWLGGVATARASLFGHAHDVALQGVAAIIVASAVAVAARSRGSATPGRSVATVAVPLAVFVALARPMSDTVAVFPYVTDDWGRSRLLWVVLGGAASAVLVAVLAGIRVRSSGRQAAGPEQRLEVAEEGR